VVYLWFTLMAATSQADFLCLPFFFGGEDTTSAN
jgi:hypothetical protein